MLRGMRWALAVLVLVLAGGPPVGAQCDPPRPASCALVAQPPGSCTRNRDCPAGYACLDGECAGAACLVRTDCPLEGECVYQGAETEGTCVCRGCGPQACPLGCLYGFFYSGCICTEESDCPPEDDVCFLGICS